MAEAPSRAIMLFGTDEPAADPRRLKAGPLTAALDAGNLRYNRHEGREAIRSNSSRRNACMDWRCRAARTANASRTSSGTSLMVICTGIIALYPR